MAKLTTGAKIMIAEVVLLFLIPLLPESILLLTDNLLVRILLIVALLGSSFFGPYVLLVTFIVILALFGLRNHLKMNKIIPQEIQQLARVDQPEAQVAIEQPSYEEPTQDMYEFAPQEDTGSNEFSPVGESINEKVVFDSPESDGNAGGMFPFPPN